MNLALLWFSRAAWLGIIANVSLALSLLVAPSWALTLFRLPLPNDLTWTRLAGLLVILLSMMYVPIAADPVKLGRMCWLLVVARAAAAAFFFIMGGPYIVFGCFDATFGVIQAILLWRAKLGA